MERKYRAVAGPFAYGFHQGNPMGQPTQLAGGYEEIWGLRHKAYPSGLGGRDIGGPMFLDRNALYYSFGKGVAPDNQNGSDFYIQGNPFALTAPSNPTDSSLWAKGGTAISRCIPTAPTVNSLVFMRETMSDGIPTPSGVQAWKNQANTAKSAGDEFLNVEFGWLPFISELRNFAKAVKNHDKILSDLHEGSSRTTRVGYTFPGVDNTTQANGSCFIICGGNASINYSVSASRFGVERTKQWFSGAFVYHLPADGSQLGKAKEFASHADKLLGVKPTPAAIWNAAPWSWALDWMANAGDILTNISELGQDGLALKYGYIMSHTMTREDVNHGPRYATGKLRITPGSRTRLREYKKRLPASPYGFGVSEEGFTPTQKAIVAALGLSKFRGGTG